MITPCFVFNIIISWLLDIYKNNDWFVITYS